MAAAGAWSTEIQRDAPEDEHKRDRPGDATAQTRAETPKGGDALWEFQQLERDAEAVQGLSLGQSGGCDPRGPGSAPRGRPLFPSPQVMYDLEGARTARTALTFFSTSRDTTPDLSMLTGVLPPHRTTSPLSPLGRPMAAREGGRATVVHTAFRLPFG